MDTWKDGPKSYIAAVGRAIHHEALEMPEKNSIQTLNRGEMIMHILVDPSLLRISEEVETKGDSNQGV